MNFRLWILLWMGLPLCASELRIAVASNADAVFAALAERFEAVHAVRVIRVSGSTGRHHAQIVNGAPFDLLFAADAETPDSLLASGHASATGTYAYGVLVLWSPTPGLIDRGGTVLGNGGFRRLALANPRVAPYGKAAEEVLASLGLFETLNPRLVRGSNIGQTAHFVSSGAADLGFIALSQVQNPDGRGIPGSFWFPPADSHASLEQKWALLRDTPAAQAFLAFLTTPEARELLAGYGYTLPEDDASESG